MLSVLCILPYHRPEFVNGAYCSMGSQTYKNKVFYVCDTREDKRPIGSIRNFMIRDGFEADLIAHFDHDDWSAPERLAEQVAFMEKTGAPVVGYHDLALYDTVRDRTIFYEAKRKDYAVGTSLLYRRSIWEALPFPDSMVEDSTWQEQLRFKGVKIAGCSSLVEGSPRLIARMHPHNTTQKNGAIYQAAGPDLDKEIRRLLP